MAKGNDHIVIKNVNSGYELECLHCGQTYSPTLPCPMDIFQAICESFQETHEDCEQIVTENAEDATR